MPSDGVFVSWVASHGRSIELAEHLGLETYFFDGPRRFRHVIVRYIANTIRTCGRLVRDRPRRVFVMIPPLPALVICSVYCMVSRASLVVDLHSGVFNDPRWVWATKVTLKIIRASGGVAIVTNSALGTICEDVGLRCVILHDPLSESEVFDTPVAGRYVLVPLSYAKDEPLEEIFVAAERLPHIEWLLTGSAPPALIARAPLNIRFTGYLSSVEYLSLLSEAGVVLALTSRTLTMQRAGYEAMNFAKALVVPNSVVLRDFFEDAAIFVELSSSGISDGVSFALCHTDELVQQMRVVRRKRILDQRGSLDQLRLGWS